MSGTGLARGGAMVLDLHMALKLRNNSFHRIRGVTMIVSAQEVTPGGRGSWARWLDVGAGEAFPLLIEIRLLRPLQRQTGPLVQVGLDGILFDNFSFYGPNRLDSKRTMMVWAKEAERDRQHFKSVLAAYGPEGLQVIGVAMDDAPKEDIQKFAQEMGVNYLVLLGKESVGEAYGGVEFLPTTFYIDRNGKVVERIFGLRSRSEIEDYVKQSLSTHVAQAQTAK